MDVKIGDVNCAVDSATETTIVCTTDAKGQSSLADIVVTIAGKGQALSNVQFYYIGGYLKYDRFNYCIVFLSYL